MTENTTEVEETFETDSEGVAYTSESAPSADTPARPATIAPAGATGRRKEAVARVRDRKSTRLNSSHSQQSRMPSSA